MRATRSDLLRGLMVYGQQNSDVEKPRRENEIAFSSPRVRGEVAVRSTAGEGAWPQF